jgi:hypothetical protein
MLAWDLVKLYDECFRTYVNASYDDMDIFLFVILCKTWCLDMIRDPHHSVLYTLLSYCIGLFINFAMRPTYLTP